MKTLVKFTKSHKSYTRGDIAGFDPLAAKTLIDGKVAVAYEAEVKINAEERPEGFAEALKALETRETAVASAEDELAGRAVEVVNGNKALDERKADLGKAEKALKTRETAVASAEADLAKNAPETSNAAPAKLPGQGAKTPAKTK